MSNLLSRQSLLDPSPIIAMLPRASFELQASIKLRATFALRAPGVNNGNFIGFLSKSTCPRPQWPIWSILDKNPNF